MDPVFILPALYEPLSGWVRTNEMLLYHLTMALVYAVMACGQWLLLRLHLHGAGWWIPASAVGGGLGWYATDAVWH